jgi:hypothetical protein
MKQYSSCYVDTEQTNRAKLGKFCMKVNQFSVKLWGGGGGGGQNRKKIKSKKLCGKKITI